MDGHPFYIRRDWGQGIRAVTLLQVPCKARMGETPKLDGTTATHNDFRAVVFINPPTALMKERGDRVVFVQVNSTQYICAISR